MNIYHYHGATGAYLGTSQADESPLEPGVFLMPAGATKLVPPTYDNLTELCLWDGTAWSVAPIPAPPEPVQPTLAEVKATKLSQITRDRDTAISQSVTVHGRPWQADETSQRNLANEILTTQAGVPMSPIWRDADNNNMVLTNIQQLVDIAAAFKAQTLTAYQTSWARKAAVAAAATVEEVDII